MMEINKISDKELEIVTEQKKVFTKEGLESELNVKEHQLETIGREKEELLNLLKHFELKS